MSKLPPSFFLRDDVVKISRELIGKKIVTHINGVVTSGLITETEAYRAPEDKASHAYNNKKTPRTLPFFEEGGIAYVYLCYGIHHLFNIVTNKVEIPHAILIRSIEPVEGVEHMLMRRSKTKLHRSLSSGPGSMAKALGITSLHNGISICEETIWLEEGISLSSDQIEACPRVGINYAEEYIDKPWRFKWKGNKWTTK